MICAPPGKIWVGMALAAGCEEEVGTALRVETEMGWDVPAMEDVKVCREDGEITCTCSITKAELLQLVKKCMENLYFTPVSW